MAGAGLVAAVAGAPALDCVDLSPITLGKCGNGVVDPGEDCDGQTNCWGPGTATPCQFRCTPALTITGTTTTGTAGSSAAATTSSSSGGGAPPFGSTSSGGPPPSTSSGGPPPSTSSGGPPPSSSSGPSSSSSSGPSSSSSAAATGSGGGGGGDAGTVTYTCPPGYGYGCGLDGVCRLPSSTFQSVATLASDTAVDLQVGDTNADGCADIVEETLQGITITRFASAASGFCTAASQTLSQTPGQALYASPLIAAPGAGTQAGLVSSSQGLLGPAVFVYAADPGGPQTPLLYAGVPLTQPAVRPLKVHSPLNDWLVLVLGGGPAGPMLQAGVVTDPHDLPTSGVDVFSGTVDQIAVLEAVNLDAATVSDGNRCDHVVAGLFNGDVLHVFQLCEANSAGMLVLDASLPDTPIHLDPGISMRSQNQSVVVMDEDGDGLPDLVMNANDANLHVAYGLGDGTFQSTPPSTGITRNQTTSALPLPPGMSALTDSGNLLVAGSFGPSGVSLSAVPCPPASGGQEFVSALCAPTSGSCEAIVADIDDDGLDDIVYSLGQQPGITVLRAQPDGAGFYTSFIDTQCPAHDLASGDLDDDGVGDIAYFDQVTPSGGTPTTVLEIAYGNPLAPPGAPVAGGRFPVVDGLAAGTFVPGSTPQLFAAQGIVEVTGAMPSSSALALLEAHDGRVMLAPYYFPGTTASPGKPYLLDVNLYAVAEGRFGSAAGETSRSLAALAQDVVTCSSPLLWYLTRGSGTNDVTGTSTPTASTGILNFTGAVLAQVDVDGDGTDELLMLADGKAVLYQVTADAFTAIGSPSTTIYRYSSVDVTASPSRYVPRPLVADLDGDGAEDVVVRATDGALIAFWGDRTKRTFTEQLLFPPPTCMGSSSGGSSSSSGNSSSSGGTSGMVACTPDAGSAGSSTCAAQSIALLNQSADWPSGRALLVVGPGQLELFTLNGRTPAPATHQIDGTIPPPPSNTDFTAVAAGDIDGDGVDDLVIMSTSSVVDVYHGVPVPP
jgi:hypothetical protein